MNSLPPRLVFSDQSIPKSTSLPFGFSSPAAGDQASFSPQSFSSPVSDRQTLVNAQIRKLAEMRKSQMAFFDSKMAVLKEAEVRVSNRADDIKKREEALIGKERHLTQILERIRSETEELVSIKELLKVENESVQLRIKDLRWLVNKYENSIKGSDKSALLERLHIARPL